MKEVDLKVSYKEGFESLAKEEKVSLRNKLIYIINKQLGLEQDETLYRSKDLT